METREDIPAPINPKIMVNFDSRLVVHTLAQHGSEGYRELLKKGYVEVGRFSPRKGQFFWRFRYFNPADKDNTP